MALVLASQFTQRTYTWSQWKAAYAVKGGPYQYDADDGIIATIYFYDTPEVHVTQIWVASVPDGVVNGGYSQSQNDADLLDFQTNWLPGANATITPRNTDGSVTVAPNAFPQGARNTFAGAGDSGVVVGGGPSFQFSTVADGYDGYLEWQFRDMVYIDGGYIFYQNAQLGDTIDYYAYAPATALNTTYATQSCTIDGYGGAAGVLIYPVVSGGPYNIDLSLATPIPNLAGTGQWNWSAPNNLGKGTITPNYNGSGNFDLYTVQITITRFMVTVPLLGSGLWSSLAPAIIPKQALPQWVHRMTINSPTESTNLQVSWALFMARYKTY